MKKYEKYIIIICLLLLFLLLLMFLKNNNKEISVEKEKYYIESDYSKFFTVNSCIYRYIEYLSSKDTSAILEVLDYSYIVENNINENNLYNYVPNLEGMYSFSSKQMYRIDLDNYAEYYVFGYLIKDSISGNNTKEKQYYTVRLDKDNMTFSIRGISENEYLEVIDE